MIEDRRKIPLEVVTAARRRELGILRLALAGLRQFIPFKRLYVITARENFGRFARALGPDVELLDEEALVPGLTLDKLRSFSLPGLPKGAGWYLQQFAKLAFAFHSSVDDHYLVWDSDTIPLRPMEFFDAEGRMFFTISDEEHPPYFENYRRLLGQEPHREFSFISQHIIVQRSIVREMIERIEKDLHGSEPWPLKIMANLRGEIPNLFSEYETVGHYVKNNYPERAVYRRLPWAREAALETKGMPSSTDLARLAQKYYFASFESWQMPLRRFALGLRRLLIRGTPAFRYK